MTAEELKKLRIDAGLTQKELADRIGTYDTKVSAWENGKYAISKAYVRIIREVLK